MFYKMKGLGKQPLLPAAHVSTRPGSWDMHIFS